MSFPICLKIASFEFLSWYLFDNFYWGHFNSVIIRFENQIQGSILRQIELFFRFSLFLQPNYILRNA